MPDYARIELETTMDAAALYRTTPYQFALTAEPGQAATKYAHLTAASMLIVPTIIVSGSVPKPVFPSVDLKFSSKPEVFGANEPEGTLAK